MIYKKFALGLLMLILLFAFFAIPVYAKTTLRGNSKEYYSEYSGTYDSVETVFYEGLLEGESKSIKEGSFRTEYENGTFRTKHVIKDNEVQYEVRMIEKSIKIKKKAKIVDFISVEIPENITLTVEKGAELTISGELYIEGKIINKGTIIINGKRNSTNEIETNICRILSRGNIENNGNIIISCGQIENELGAVLNNAGTITITNQEKELTGLSNVSTVRKGKPIPSEINNTGTIYVQNTNGIGIQNFKNSIFNNNGMIYKNKDVIIKGKLTGNKPILKS